MAGSSGEQTGEDRRGDFSRVVLNRWWRTRDERAALRIRDLLDRVISFAPIHDRLRQSWCHSFE